MVSRARRVVLLLALLTLWPFTTGFGPPHLVESDDVRMPIGPTGLQALYRIPPPAPAGTASLVLDGVTGQVMYEHNGSALLAPASITKIMTAVLAIEFGDLSQQVVILEEDLVEGSSMGLQPGDQVTLEQLLWGLLLPSGNDAAQAIARTLGGGSVASFVDLMNQKAEKLHLWDTHFVNPHGLDEMDHFSSAYDLAQLSRYALDMPLFARIVSTKEHTVQANRTFLLHTTNQLLFLSESVPGVNGVKTGFTDLAGDSLVASVDRDGRKLIVVVLGTQDRASAATALINYAYRYFTWLPLKGGLPLPKAMAGLTPYDVLVMLPAWQMPYFRVATDLAGTPEQPWGAPQGVLAAYVGAQEIGRVPLFALSGP